MPDGTVVLANIKKGEILTDTDKQAIAEWVQFCRERRALEQHKANKNCPAQSRGKGNDLRK
jgi:hypothetical protein